MAWSNLQDRGSSSGTRSDDGLFVQDMRNGFWVRAEALQVVEDPDRVPTRVIQREEGGKTVLGAVRKTHKTEKW